MRIFFLDVSRLFAGSDSSKAGLARHSPECHKSGCEISVTIVRVARDDREFASQSYCFLKLLVHVLTLFRNIFCKDRNRGESGMVLPLGRALAATCILLLDACATQDVAKIQASAEFESFPKQLFSKAEDACSHPSETFVRLSREVIECRLLLPPETTAAVILTYDGAVEELPQAVIRFTARAKGDGYAVEILPYLRVPQRNGAPLRVAQPDPSLFQQMQSLLLLTGGQIEE